MAPWLQCYLFNCGLNEVAGSANGWNSLPAAEKIQVGRCKHKDAAQGFGISWATKCKKQRDHLVGFLNLLCVMFIPLLSTGRGVPVVQPGVPTFCSCKDRRQSSRFSFCGLSWKTSFQGLSSFLGNCLCLRSPLGLDSWWGVRRLGSEGWDMSDKSGRVRRRGMCTAAIRMLQWYRGI